MHKMRFLGLHYFLVENLLFYLVQIITTFNIFQFCKQMMKNVTINSIDMVGIIAFHISQQIFILFFSCGAGSICFETLTAEFAIFVLLNLCSTFELIISFATSETNTTMGITSPCSSQMSISLMLESSGS